MSSRRFDSGITNYAADEDMAKQMRSVEANRLLLERLRKVTLRCNHHAQYDQNHRGESLLNSSAVTREYVELLSIEGQDASDSRIITFSDGSRLSSPSYEFNHNERGQGYSASYSRASIQQNHFASMSAASATSYMLPYMTPYSCRTIESPLSSGESSGMSSYSDPPRFKPSRPILGEPRSASLGILQRAALAGVDLSGRYRGGISDFNIKNAQCPDHLNCNIRICNIPSDAEDKELFDIITDGKVFAFNKNPPIPGVHSTCAADLAFMTRSAAESLMRRANSEEGLWLRAHKLRVIWNRNKFCPRPESEQRQSRVIHISGPADKISLEMLETYLHNFVVFQLVNGQEWLIGGGRKIVELAFGSIRGQSRSVFLCLLENVKGTDLEGQLTVYYGPDPCEPMSSPTVLSSNNWRKAS